VGMVCNNSNVIVERFLDEASVHDVIGDYAVFEVEGDYIMVGLTRMVIETAKTQRVIIDTHTVIASSLSKVASIPVGCAYGNANINCYTSTSVDAGDGRERGKEWKMMSAERNVKIAHVTSKGIAVMCYVAKRRNCWYDHEGMRISCADDYICFIVDWGYDTNNGSSDTFSSIVVYKRILIIVEVIEKSFKGMKLYVWMFVNAMIRVWHPDITKKGMKPIGKTFVMTWDGMFVGEVYMLYNRIVTKISENGSKRKKFVKMDMKTDEMMTDMIMENTNVEVIDNAAILGSTFEIIERMVEVKVLTLKEDEFPLVDMIQEVVLIDDVLCFILPISLVNDYDLTMHHIVIDDLDVYIEEDILDIMLGDDVMPESLKVIKGVYADIEGKVDNIGGKVNTDVRVNNIIDTGGQNCDVDECSRVVRIQETRYDNIEYKLKLKRDIMKVTFKADSVDVEKDDVDFATITDSHTTILIDYEDDKMVKHSVNEDVGIDIYDKAESECVEQMVGALDGRDEGDVDEDSGKDNDVERVEMGAHRDGVVVIDIFNVMGMVSCIVEMPFCAWIGQRTCVWQFLGG